MRPSVGRLEETYQNRVDFHILNIDYLNSRDLANTYRVVGIPMIVLLDVEGEIFQDVRADSISNSTDNC